jgi:hypothetical protein
VKVALLHQVGPVLLAGSDHSSGSSSY